jgi:hypothetical protein
LAQAPPQRSGGTQPAGAQVRGATYWAQRVDQDEEMSQTVAKELPERERVD